MTIILICDYITICLLSFSIWIALELIDTLLGDKSTNQIFYLKTFLIQLLIPFPYQRYLTNKICFMRVPDFSNVIHSHSLL